MYGFIYMTINKINNNKYIGRRKYNANWEYYLGSGIAFKNALSKYGRESFERITLCECVDKKDLDYKEKYWIDFYDACAREDFYNIAEGGYGNPRKGMDEKRLKEWAEKRTKTIVDNGILAGENNPMFGKSHSEETKRKIGEANKNYVPSDYNKLMTRVKNSGSNNPSARKIICNTTGEVFEYASLAAEKYNIDLSSIIKCCKGKLRNRGKHPETNKPLSWSYYCE